MINETRVVETDRSDYLYKCRRKCISWSAIVAGALVGFALSFLLNLLCVAIGLTAFTNTQEGVQAIAIGGLIGFIIVSIISMFFAGFVAGHLGSRYSPRRHFGCLYGFLTFGVALLLVVVLSMPMTRFMHHFNDNLYPRSNAAAVIANPMSDSSTMVSSQGVTTRAGAMDRTNSSAAANTEQAANDLGKAALVTFILFAIGALSAVIGGHFGMRCRCKDDEYYEEMRIKEERVVR